jgi:DNA repair protein RecO (recombination protein O)
VKQLVTSAIILRRTDYGEADRIITMLTPEYGKIALLARGVRKVKSKLAGGIELFSVSEITFIKGRGDVGTLVSARLKKHYSMVVTDIERTMLGYDLIKQLNKATEDEPEPDYFNVLHAAFEALDDRDIALDIIRFWFAAQLLRLAGHTPNLQSDTTGAVLRSDEQYSFDSDAMAFRVAHAKGQYGADHIKFLRLAFAGHVPRILAHVHGIGTVLPQSLALVQAAAASR